MKLSKYSCTSFEFIDRYNIVREFALPESIDANNGVPSLVNASFRSFRHEYPKEESSIQGSPQDSCVVFAYTRFVS